MAGPAINVSRRQRSGTTKTNGADAKIAGLAVAFSAEKVNAERLSVKSNGFWATAKVGAPGATSVVNA